MSAFKFEWFVREPKVILDVGTYDGADAALFKETFPLCRVIAFEACPDNYGAMKRRAFAAATGVELVHAAACDFDGEIPFFSNTDTKQVGHFGQSGSVLEPTKAIDNKWRGGMGHIRFKEPRRVPAVRLDTFCAAQGITAIDLLHMDVQGAESMVLDGMGALLPGMIFLEIDEVKETGGYLGCVPLAELEARLTSRGYVKQWASINDALYVSTR